MGVDSVRQLPPFVGVLKLHVLNGSQVFSLFRRTVHERMKDPDQRERFEAKNCVKKKHFESRATVSALTFVKSTSNKFLITTSVAVNT